MKKIWVFWTIAVLCAIAGAVVYWKGGLITLDELKILISSKIFLFTAFGVIVVTAVLYQGCGFCTTIFSKYIGNIKPNSEVCKITGTMEYRKIELRRPMQSPRGERYGKGWWDKLKDKALFWMNNETEIGADNQSLED